MTDQLLRERIENADKTLTGLKDRLLLLRNIYRTWADDRNNHYQERNTCHNICCEIGSVLAETPWEVAKIDAALEAEPEPEKCGNRHCEKCGWTCHREKGHDGRCEDGPMTWIEPPAPPPAVPFTAAHHDAIIRILEAFQIPDAVAVPFREVSRFGWIDKALDALKRIPTPKPRKAVRK